MQWRAMGAVPVAVRRMGGGDLDADARGCLQKAATYTYAAALPD